VEVNEQIIEQYIKLKNWFYVSDISYKVPGNYSNIDLLAYDPVRRKYYDFEVKYRSAFTVSSTKLGSDKNFKKYIKQFTRRERQEAIKKIIGNRTVTKIFVTTHKLFGLTVDKREKVEQEFIRRVSLRGYNCIVWYFDDIIPEIFDKTNLKGRHNTELMQTLRLIKTYKKD
jgi:hypothetical protein